MSVSLLPYIQTSLVNHQGFTITFSKYKGKVVCHYSQGDIPLGTNIPFFITEDPPPLSAYTITYYPSHKVFVWDHYGLRGGMEGGGDISSKKESSTGQGTTYNNNAPVTNQGNISIDTQNNHPVADTITNQGIIQIGTQNINKPLTESEKKADLFSRLSQSPLESFAEPLFDFIGRESLIEQIANRLTSISSQGPSCVCVLWGPPGIGKTELAIKFANQFETLSPCF